MKKIILASASPRRRILLKQIIGDNFKVIVSDYEEKNDLDMEPVEMAMYHSLQKGKYVASNLKEGIIISADTFVVFGNEVLGKPFNAEDAKNMLSKISGEWIDVVSGIAVRDVENGKVLQEHEVTRVKIKDMTDEEIDKYVATGEPLDKAGAFGAQEKGAVLIEKVEGCFHNVVGLPLFKLKKMLEKIGVNIFQY